MFTYHIKCDLVTDHWHPVDVTVSYDTLDLALADKVSTFLCENRKYWHLDQKVLVVT